MREDTVSKGATGLGLVSGLVAMTSAAACCVLPLLLSTVGIGAAGLAPLVPLHWPLTLLAAVAVLVAWTLFLRRRRGAQRAGRGGATFILLSIATAFTLVSACWSLFEAPLMGLLLRTI